MRIVIGLQRELNEKPVGMRTLALVSLGTAIVTVATLRYPTLEMELTPQGAWCKASSRGSWRVWGSLVPAQSCAITAPRKVHGLTTATTVWIAAALGIACGLPDWTVAVTGAVLALIILTVLKWFERRLGPDLEQH